MNQETLYQTIDRIFCTLKVLREQYKTIDTWAETRQLMDDTVDIYIALKTNPSIEEDTKFQDYIRKSAIELTSCTDYIYDFIVDMEQTLDSTFYSNEWDGICWQRSAVEAIKEMYQNTCLEEHFDDLDTEEVDDFIKEKGKHEGYIPESEIPIGIPSSHWWWWYPEIPTTREIDNIQK